MAEEIKTTENTAAAAPKAADAKRAPRSMDRNRGPRPGGQGPRRPFNDRPKDVDQKILEIRRVTRVVAGGRRMSFAVSMVIGDKQGVVGVGVGKGNDTALAIGKALKDAKKNAIKIKRTEKLSIPFDVKAKYNASRVMIFPNNGKGLVAGAAIRDILSLAGVRDVTSKIVSGSKNKLNTARATIDALRAVAVPHVFGSDRPAPAAAVEPASTKA